MVGRRYLPATMPLLRTLHERSELHVDDSAIEPEDEAEESEYAAMMTAADLSAELVAGLPDGERRRVVVVVDIGRSTPPLTVPLRKVLAVHIDPADDARPDDDLAWFATQELPDLV